MWAAALGGLFVFFFFFLVVRVKVMGRLVMTQTRVKNFWRDFPGDLVVKNPPANAGDTGSIPGIP